MLPATAEERSDLQPMRMEQASRAAPSEDIAYVVVNQHEDATEGVPLMIPDTSDFAKVTVKTDAEENIVNVCGLRMKRRQRTLLVASLLTLIGTCWFAVEVSSFKSGNGLTTKASPPSADGSGGPSLTDKFKSLMQAGFSFLGNAFKPTETDVYGKPLIYDPQIYPWARDVESFLNKLDKGIEVIKAKRQAIWDKHQPVAEAFLVGDLDTFNEGQVVKDMAKATLEQSTYRIGVMGTSVTAGHDNYFWQSYPIVWGAHMQESFDSLGINFTVVNSAMGWNPLNPS